MVIRLVAVPDFLDLADFDEIFHAVLGWDSGMGYAFQVHGQEFNSISRRTKSKKLRDFRLHRQEKFLYTLGAMDQWEWELRLVNLEDGSAGRRNAGVFRRAGSVAAAVLWWSDRISADAKTTGTW